MVYQEKPLEERVRFGLSMLGWVALARRAHARGCVLVAMERRLIGRVVSIGTFF